MFILMIIVFVLGYTAIALEHPLKVDKAASALMIGSLTWVIFIMGGFDILNLGFSRAWEEFKTSIPADVLSNPVEAKEYIQDFIVHKEILHHLGEISQILFFLLGAMTIVEIVDQYQGFKVITDKIKTTNKVKLLWILSFLTFFMSAALDNLTTTIVLVALLRKLIADKKTRWFFASMVILAANAGGAWSPIGDVTTIMLWIGGQVTAANIIAMVIFPSLVTMIIPVVLLSYTMKGNVERPVLDSANNREYTSARERIFILILGVSALLFVPVFKTLTHLPPYMGMLFGLSVLWIVTEILGRRKSDDDRRKLSVVSILSKVDVPTVLFFLGILSAVASLQSAGHLDLLAGVLDEKLGNIYLINTAIGILSAIVDNVPLVAGAMGMYEIYPNIIVHMDANMLSTIQSLDFSMLSTITADALPNFTPEMIEMTQKLKPEAFTLIQEINPEDLMYVNHFVTDGTFWELLAFCAGTGGSILIIGSAAGVAAMGMEKIDFIWYMKKISYLAFIGYVAGIGAFYLQDMLLHG